MSKKSKTKTTDTMPEKEAESNYEKWIKKLPDFTLVANSGEELKCHKSFLVMHSPVFDTMISSQFKEAKSNRATMKDFDAATVKSFLEFIYAKSKDEGRDFEASKYTPSLLRMAHMYECQELVTACVNGLKKSINDVDIVNSAEVLDVARLVDSRPLKEVIFARMLDEEDPMGAVQRVGLFHPEEYLELMEAWQKKYKKMKEDLETIVTIAGS